MVGPGQGQRGVRILTTSLVAMKLSRGRGQWNAYVVAGATREERARRLLEVPEAWRESVADHVRTVFNLRGRVTRGRSPRGR